MTTRRTLLNGLLAVGAVSAIESDWRSEYRERTTRNGTQ